MAPFVHEAFSTWYESSYHMDYDVKINEHRVT
jgi:hypothetical protein